jgi:hypothetical protein
VQLPSLALQPPRRALACLSSEIKSDEHDDFLATTSPTAAFDIAFEHFKLAEEP